jgi:hypothetical protein
MPADAVDHVNAGESLQESRVGGIVEPASEQVQAGKDLYVELAVSPAAAPGPEGDELGRCLCRQGACQPECISLTAAEMSFFAKQDWIDDGDAG